MTTEDNQVEEIQGLLDDNSINSRSAKAGAFRRFLYVVAGLAVFVGGAVVLGRGGAPEGPQTGSGAFGSTPARSVATEGSRSIEQFEDVYLQVYNPDNFVWTAAGKQAAVKAYLSTVSFIGGVAPEDQVYIGYTDTDMFYVVSTLNYLGQYVCAITQNQRCQNLANDRIPAHVSESDVMGLLQALRDADDGLEQLHQFDDNALHTAHSLVDQGYHEAVDARNHLSDIFAIDNALAGTRVAGDIVVAVMSVTPFAFIGAIVNICVQTSTHLIQGLATQPEIAKAQASLGAKILGMGTYADESPVLQFLNNFHDAENRITQHFTTLITDGPLKIVQGSDQEVMRRFLQGLAQITDSIYDMEELLIDFHNEFFNNMFTGFTVWKQVAHSMTEVEDVDVSEDLINGQTAGAGISPSVFSGISSALLAGGMTSSRKAAKWAGQAYGYKIRVTDPNGQRVTKLRNIGVDPRAPRRALMYSRMTAGLSVSSAIVQGVALGFKIAEQQNLLHTYDTNMERARNNVKTYYTNIKQAIDNMSDDNTLQNNNPTAAFLNDNAEWVASS